MGRCRNSWLVFATNLLATALEVHFTVAVVVEMRGGREEKGLTFQRTEQ